VWPDGVGKFAPEGKVRIVLEGLRGEQSISELCRREGIASNLYYRPDMGRFAPIQVNLTECLFGSTGQRNIII
jgi:hypothetical protein